MGFPRQEYHFLPFPSPGDLPNPGIEPTSPTLAGRFFTTEPPGKLHSKVEGKTKGQLSPRTSTREKPVCCNEDTTCMCVLSCFSCVWLLVTLWTAARRAPLSMGLFRQEYWSGLPCPPPGTLPDPGIGPGVPTLQDHWATRKAQLSAYESSIPCQQ